MKMLVVSIAFMTTSAAVAAVPACPKGSQSVLDCVSNPKKGDHSVAADMFDAIKICQKGEKAWMIASIGDEGQKMPAQVEMRMGGTTYSVTADDTIFALSVPVIFADEIPATYSVNMTAAGIKASSTYSCRR